MAKLRAPLLYTETRLNLDQAHASSTIDITLSRTSNFERRIHSDVRVGSDEAHFTREHIASDASVYFRRDERYPRSFLWRLLDERSTLELQSVDLSQDSSEKTEAIITILLRFPAAIRPFCIAFADPDEKDALNVFAITTTNELWTLTLHREFFINPKATENLTSDWCKWTKPSIFAVTTPYRLFSSSSRELYMSMVDGQVVRMTRAAGEDGSRWHDIVYSAGKWGVSLVRSLNLTWTAKPSVKLGDIDIDAFAAVSIAPTAFDEDDAHLVTVCLDHTLRIWNLKTGRISAEIDILGEEDQKYLIGANTQQLLQVVEMPGRQEFYAVTYSPKFHRFKFWAISDADAGRQGIREMRPEIEYTPPIDTIMDTAVWNLEEFHLRPSRGAKQTELWIRVRSGQTSQLFMLTFDPFDFGHKLHDVDSTFVRDAWAEDWVTVSRGRQSLEVLDGLSPLNLEDLEVDVEVPNVTERWLSFLFYPGRFTMPLLETALETFLSDSGSSSAYSKAPLKDRLIKAVWAGTAKAHGSRAKGTNVNSKEQWQKLYGIVRDLHKRRTDTLSFALDPWDQLAWLVSADSVSPIRKCSDLELADANRENVQSGALSNEHRVLYSMDHEDNESRSEDEDLDEDSLIGNLTHVAHALRSALPASFQESFKQAITADIMDDPASSVADRMHTIQKKSTLLSQVTQDEEERFDDIVKDFGQYSIFHTQKFLKVLSTLNEPEAGRHQQEQITRFGARMLVRTAQESVSLSMEVLLDLLAVVLYLEASFEADELCAAISGLSEDIDTMDVDNLSSAFDSHLLFEQIMKLLRDNIVLDFLTSSIRKEHTKKRRKSSADSPLTRIGSAPASEPVYSLTLLESMFIGYWAEVRAPEDISMPEWITYMSRAWLTKLDVKQYENFSAHVLADLIKHGDTQLGAQFTPFVPLTSWSSYLRGRLSLESGDHDAAANWFKKSAFAMALDIFDVNNADTAGLLRPDQVEKFSDGLAAYNEHVMDLFGHAKASAQVAGFAKSALQAHYKDVEQAQSKGMTPKPLPEKQAAEYQKRETELLSRLFTASIQRFHFDDAYSALTRMAATGVRHFCLQQFIKTLVEHANVKQLFSYPWAQLADEADDELAKQAKKTLSLGSKPEYYKILYSWRIKRGNYRGAAQAAFERLERMRREGREDLVEGYLLLINALACVGREEAWVIREPVSEMRGLINGTAKEKKEGRRGLVTVEDVRREYQDELDRLAALEQGKFAFNAEVGEAMDVL